LTVSVSVRPAATASAAEPTSICIPTAIIRLPPPEAPRTDSVATASATTPTTHSASPNGSTPPVMRVPMISATPTNPATSPATPISGSRSPQTAHSAKATTSGMLEATMAATEAGMVCIATK
jgi:hypothetical protein